MSAIEPTVRLRSLWVSWNDHRRTAGLCAAWGVPLHIIRSDHDGLRRWIGKAVATIRLLRAHRPELLLVQNPSLLLTVLAVLTRRLFRFYLVVDAHNEGIRPFDRPGAFFQWLTRQLLKRADATIISNAALAVDVVAAGGRPLVLPDPLPVPPPIAASDGPVERAPQVVVIATFRRDEPIASIIAAAATMPGIRFVFSGDAGKFLKNGVELPANVRLGGYLPDPAYWELLAGADVICDLTLKPDCLVCGAYEALALAKPMVLSDNPATREIFDPAAILTGSEPDEIAGALRDALEQRGRLMACARERRDAYRARWPALAAAVRDAVVAGATGNSDSHRAGSRHAR